MTPAPPSDRELDAYREEADRFIAELDEEFYLHYAGHKETFDLTPIYQRHTNLTDLAAAKQVKGARKALKADLNATHEAVHQARSSASEAVKNARAALKDLRASFQK